MVRRCPYVDDYISKDRDGGKRPRQIMCGCTCQTNRQLDDTMDAYQSDDPFHQKYKTSFTRGNSGVSEVNCCIGRAQRLGSKYIMEDIERENGNFASIADYTRNHGIKPSFRHENIDRGHSRHAVRFCSGMRISTLQ